MTDDQALESAIPTCPKCQGEMWDNRENKRNPRAPDFKCKDKGCDGVIWPPRDANAPPPAPRGTEDDPPCPVCGGRMWDDRLSKRNPKAPDFKCRNKPKVMGGPGCQGVIWPPREGEAPRRPAAATPARGGAPAPAPRGGGLPSPSRQAPPSAPPAWDRPVTDDELPDDDDLPF